MTVHISLLPEAETKLRERAAASGQTVEAYVSRLVHDAAVTPSVDELLAPFHKQVSESGMTDEELDAYFEDPREQVWRDTTPNSPTPA